MRFADIGQQLRAYRLESGLRAEEIAARLGVSRAALYRYEKGEVIKLDTIRRLAELLKISPLSLLGIGVEYFSRPIAFQERLRQVEEQSDQILQVGGAVCYQTTTEAFDGALAEAWAEAADSAPERIAARAAADQAMGLLTARKKLHQSRRATIIAMLSEAALRRFLMDGVAAGLALSDRTRTRCRPGRPSRGGEHRRADGKRADRPAARPAGRRDGGQFPGAARARAGACLHLPLPARPDLQPGHRRRHHHRGGRGGGGASARGRGRLAPGAEGRRRRRAGARRDPRGRAALSPPCRRTCPPAC
ncbi:helix-turn-helix domain-containing protein [Pseudoroseomonas cervicalis]|uniref:helix-turn-helix domain-containing protein n=1 Tax=Teichococcus cervicalis TaxID=204525 RepID=UPI0035F045DF